MHGCGVEGDRSEPGNRRRGLRWWVVVGTLAVIAAACGGPTGDTEDADTPSAEETSEDGADPDLVTIEVGEDPGPVMFGEGAVWVGWADGLDRVDSDTHEVVTVEVEIPFEADHDMPVLGIAAGEGAVWARFGAVGLARIDPDTHELISFIDSRAIRRFDVGEGAVWSLSGRPSIVRIDAATEEGGDPVRLDDFGRAFPHPRDLKVGQGAVWATYYAEPLGEDNHRNVVAKIDPATSELVATLELAASENFRKAGRVAIEAGAVWVDTGDHIVRIDPDTVEVVATVDAPATAHRPTNRLAVGADSVWVLGDDTVRRIDPQTNSVADTINLDKADYTSMTFGDDSLWITHRFGGTLTRIVL